MSNENAQATCYNLIAVNLNNNLNMTPQKEVCAILKATFGIKANFFTSPRKNGQEHWACKLDKKNGRDAEWRDGINQLINDGKIVGWQLYVSSRDGSVMGVWTMSDTPVVVNKRIKPDNNLMLAAATEIQDLN